jgi:hypothetical protein
MKPAGSFNTEIYKIEIEIRILFIYLFIYKTRTRGSLISQFLKKKVTEGYKRESDNRPTLVVFLAI